MNQETSANNSISILAVDDDPSYRKFLQELLKRAGYEVIAAADGEEGLKLARKHRPNLILLDVLMPGMSGGMVAYQLSENILTREIPILFLTSIIEQEQEMVVCHLDGQYPFLAKTIGADRLLSEVERALQGTSMLAEERVG